MQAARGSRISIESIVIEIVWRMREYFFARMQSRSGVSPPRADRLILEGNKSRRERKMADQSDDVGMPIKPMRPAAGATAPARVPDQSRFSVEPAPVLASSPMPNLPRPAAQPAMAAGLPRQRIDQSVGLPDNEVDARTLIVGREISFSGEVASCDRLIVEGSIEANLQNCQNMVVAETGVFRGHGSTGNADVRGRVEGELVVDKRLLIRASGHVSGAITYGEIEIEAGGRISGTIQAPTR